jgi:hypothetical protein
MACHRNERRPGVAQGLRGRNVTLRAAALLFGRGTGAVSNLTAQTVSIRPELGAQLTYWRLEADGYNRVGPTVHLGVFLPRGTPIALRVFERGRS